MPTQHIAEQLDAFAALAGGDKLLDEAARFARIRLEFGGTFEAWQIRLDMMKAKKLDGKEGTACFGALHNRLEVAQDCYVRVPTVLPAEYLTHGAGQAVAPEIVTAMQKVLDDAHGNLNSRWRRMTPAERAAAGNRA